MGKDSGSSSGEGVIRYAPYIEAKHETFLNNSQTFGVTARANNPYTSYTDLDYDDAFFGSGYVMSSFPSLYDMFGKFMAGLDIESLWDQVLNDVQHSTTIQESVVAHRDLISDEVEQTALPRFQTGIRDMNAVMSSSFVIGKSIIEQGAVKKLAEFDANLRYKLIPVAAEVFVKHLAWNQGMITTYINVMKMAILTKMDTDTANYSYALKETMWPFSVLEQERANLGALQGAMANSAGGESGGAGILGGAMSGAAMGGSTGNPWAALAGGVIGGIAGAFG